MRQQYQVKWSNNLALTFFKSISSAVKWASTLTIQWANLLNESLNYVRWASNKKKRPVKWASTMAFWNAAILLPNCVSTETCAPVRLEPGPDPKCKQ